jgi:hypothetical protein
MSGIEIDTANMGKKLGEQPVLRHHLRPPDFYAGRLEYQGFSLVPSIESMSQARYARAIIVLDSRRLNRLSILHTCPLTSGEEPTNGRPMMIVRWIGLRFTARTRSA